METFCLLRFFTFLYLTRPEKTLQLLLLILIFIYKVIFNPEIALHLCYRKKRKRALLRSNSPGIFQSDEHINPSLSLHLVADLL